MTVGVARLEFEIVVFNVGLFVLIVMVQVVVVVTTVGI